MTDLDEKKAREQARWEAEATVTRVAVDHLGAQWVERPSLYTFEGAPKTREPSPLIAIRAARIVEFTGHARARHFAEQARGDGESWDIIGAALGLDTSATFAEENRGYLAFLFCTGSLSSAYWRCATCGERVTDGGPENGPTEETGHGDGCERHAREVAEQRASWDDE